MHVKPHISRVTSIRGENNLSYLMLWDLKSLTKRAARLRVRIQLEVRSSTQNLETHLNRVWSIRKTKKKGEIIKLENMKELTFFHDLGRLIIFKFREYYRQRVFPFY